MPLVPRLLNRLIAPCCCSGNNIICFNDDNGLRRFSLSVWTLKSLNFPPGRPFQVSVFLSSLCCAEGRHVPSVSVVYCFFNFFFGVFFLCLPSDYMCSSPANYCHCSSPLLSVAACLQPEAAVAAPLAITPQERETHGHDSHVNTHTHTRTHINKQWLRASLTGRLIVSQELIVKLEKLERHESCAWTCTSSCLCARAQSPAPRKFLQISVKSIKCLWIWNYHRLWGIAGTGLSKCVYIFVLHDKALRFGNTAGVCDLLTGQRLKFSREISFFCLISF